MSVTAPAGFSASGLACGIKEGEVADLALVSADDGPVTAAAVFTTNRASAAPVQVSRAHLDASGGRAAAVVLNSGCANAATGVAGVDAANATCAAVATELGIDESSVLVCSTGLIGIPLRVERILDAVPELVRSRGSSSTDGNRAATAILTTDTHAKQVVIDGRGFTVGGMAKGAGMIAPNMATMLVVLTTDAETDAPTLSAALRIAVAGSFNELIVDGCTSTNDTVIVLASGRAGPVDAARLTGALTAACVDLAEQLAGDAEGTTKVAEITVTGAATPEDARLAARMVAGSLLVKTSLFGSDPYWGRVVSELGASGAAFDLDRVAVAYGGIVVCRDGVAIPHDEGAVHAHLEGSRVEVQCDLGIGGATATVLTTDLGHGYIDENMRTS